MEQCDSKYLIKEIFTDIKLAVILTAIKCVNNIL